VIIGAGGIGRGVVAPRVAAAGMAPVLVDVDAGLLLALDAAGSYHVRLVSRLMREDIRVDGYRTVALGDKEALSEAVAGCALISVSVGVAHLDAVARQLAPALARRSEPVNVLLCENASDAAVRLAAALLRYGVDGGKVACVATSVEAMRRRVEGSLDIIGEPRQPVFVARHDWRGAELELPEFVFVDDLAALYARKLYTNNAGHAVLSYVGWRFGLESIATAASDPRVVPFLDDLLKVAVPALVHAYCLDEGALAEHVVDLVGTRFRNPELDDSTLRVGRDVVRKLSRKERLVGLMRLAEAAGLPTLPITRVIGAALHFAPPGQAEDGFAHIVRQLSVEAMLPIITGVLPGEQAFGEVVDAYAAWADPVHAVRTMHGA
jgi:mannitol-1-phosphate 5-dehydrogenase